MNSNYIVTQVFEVEAANYREAAEKARAEQLAATHKGRAYLVQIAPTPPLAVVL